MIYTGDCLKILPTLDAESVDSIVTDPPYGLSFMGKDWDHGVPGVPFWEAALRVAKPGAYLLAFGGTRTFHRLAVAIEDAGWEIRDTVGWIYGSGFPKSLDVSKAIDKAAGAARTEIIGTRHRNVKPFDDEVAGWNPNNTTGDHNYTAPATDAARQWEGWGTALKPAWEPIIVARKLTEGTVAQNVLKFGTGGLNIDGCRVGIDPKADASQLRTMNRSKKSEKNGWGMNQTGSDTPEVVSEKGRWPANLIHDGSDEVVGLFPHSKSGAMLKPYTYTNTGFSLGAPAGETRQIHESNEGSAARFFYCAKASRSERGEGNNHPTVKPLALMRYLCRLVTPPGGVILDPFMGSGSTGKAAAAERCGFIGIELNPDYVAMSESRIYSDGSPLFSEAANGC